MSERIAPVARAKDGRWVSTKCPDPNCSGALRMHEDGWLLCDGLTYKGDNDELEACTYMVEA